MDTTGDDDSSGSSSSSTHLHQTVKHRNDPISWTYSLLIEERARSSEEKLLPQLAAPYYVIFHGTTVVAVETSKPMSKEEIDNNYKDFALLDARVLFSTHYEDSGVDMSETNMEIKRAKLNDLAKRRAMILGEFVGKNKDPIDCIILRALFKLNRVHKGWTDDPHRIKIDPSNLLTIPLPDGCGDTFNVMSDPENSTFVPFISRPALMSYHEAEPAGVVLRDMANSIPIFVIEWEEKSKARGGHGMLVTPVRDRVSTISAELKAMLDARAELRRKQREKTDAELLELAVATAIPADDGDDDVATDAGVSVKKSKKTSVRGGRDGIGKKKKRKKKE